MAMRDTCFGPEADAADVLRGVDEAGESTFPVLARNCGRDLDRDGARACGDLAEGLASGLVVFEPELAPAAQMTLTPAIFVGGEARGRFGESTSETPS